MSALTRPGQQPEVADNPKTDPSGPGTPTSKEQPNPTVLQPLRDAVVAKARTLETVRQRFEAGVVSAIEVASAEAGLAESKILLAEAEGDPVAVAEQLEELVRHRLQERNLIAKRVELGVEGTNVLDLAEGRLADAKVRLARLKPVSVAPEPRPASGAAVRPSPFDALDPQKIPPEERMPWLPKGTVAVIGSHKGGKFDAKGRLELGPDMKPLSPVENPVTNRFSGPVVMGGQVVTILSGGKNAQIWSVRDGAFQKDGEGFTVFGTAGKPAGVGAMFATQATNLHVHVYEKDGSVFVERTQFGGTSTIDSERVAAYVWHPKVPALLIAYGDGAVALCDLSPGRRVLTPLGKFPVGGPLAISPDSKTLFRGNALWSLSDAKPTPQELPSFKSYPASAVFTPDGKLLVGYSDNVIRIFEVTDPTKYETFCEDGGGSLLLSPDGSRLLAHDRNRLTLWDVKTRAFLTFFTVLEPGWDQYRVQLAWADDNRHFAWGQNGVLYVIRLPSPGTTSAAPAGIQFDEAKTKALQESWAKQLGVPVQVENSAGMKLRLIPPGEFLMGSSDKDDNLYMVGPQHKVTVKGPFYIGVHEVTRGQYESVVKPAKPSAKDTLDLPVTNISWHDAKEFCKQLSEREEEKKAGRTYRLVSDVEFEYACRAGTTAPYYFGAMEKIEEFAWFADNSNGKPQPVGKKKPNAWGLHDMIGNVHEWCQDSFAQYKPGDVEHDPRKPIFSVGAGRVVRSSNFNTSAKFARSTSRAMNDPAFKSEFTGFRVVMLFESKEQP